MARAREIGVEEEGPRKSLILGGFMVYRGLSGPGENSAGLLVHSSPFGSFLPGKGSALPEFHAIDLLEASGRLSYNRLLVMVRKVSRSVFAAQFVHPMLIGSSLFAGRFLDARMAGVTMRFSFSDPGGGDTTQGGDAPDPSGLRRAIFPLIKKPFSKYAANVYAIGRTNANDMVMADHTVSREHAIIRIDRGRYFVTDLGSTNGTVVNGRRLEREEELNIIGGDEISFGRYNYRFTHADKVYEILKGV